MSTNELLDKINNREAALRARAAETAAREAELRDLRESLARLERTRSGIRGAIEDALSGSNDPSYNTSIHTADLIELAVEGNSSHNPFKDGNGNLAAEEAVGLALASMRDDLGSKGLVKFIIQTAVDTSGMDAEGVIKAALETIRGSDLTVQDVVLAATRAARRSRQISAYEIIRPAVAVALELGCEIPVIIKEVFVAASQRLDPSMIRSSLLSVLGCAMGMGMKYKDIKNLIKTFSKEVKHGALGQRHAEDKRVGFSTPLESRDPDISEPQQLQQSPSSAEPVQYGDTLGLSTGQYTNDDPLEPIHDGDPGPSAEGDSSTPPTSWTAEEAIAQGPLSNIRGSSSGVVAALVSAKRSAVGDEGEDGEEQSRPSKKVKIDFEGRRNRAQAKGKR